MTRPPANSVPTPPPSPADALTVREQALDARAARLDTRAAALDTRANELDARQAPRDARQRAVGLMVAVAIVAALGTWAAPLLQALLEHWLSDGAAVAAAGAVPPVP